MVKVTINGKEIEVEPNTTILHAAETAGFKIPTFCYNPRMDPAGSCRICAVELEDSKRTVMGCITAVSEGMKVLTESPKVHDARKTNLELLLLHHPLDCPVCDCGGECPLQNMSFAYGASDSRFESHRNDEAEDLKSEVLVFNSNRCILCGKCVRICDEIQDVHAIGFINRGFDTIIGPPLGKKLDCEFCGDCLEVCPTGAITDRFIRYQFRPWQMEKTETTCTACGSGCRMLVDTESEAIVRISSREGLGPNEGSICVVGRFGYNSIQSRDRLDKPHYKRAQRLVPSTWSDLLPQISAQLRSIVAGGPGRVAGLISSDLPMEDAFLFQRFMRQTLRSNYIDSGARRGLMNMALPLAASTGSLRPLVDNEDIIKADLILVLGADPAVESNITGLAIKKAVRKNKADLYLVHGHDVSISTRAKEVIKLIPDAEGIFVRLLRSALGMPPGMPLSEKMKASFSEIGASVDAVERLLEDMAHSKRMIVVTGRRFHHSKEGHEASEQLIGILSDRGLFSSEGSGLFVLPELGNDFGVLMMGGTSEWLPGLLDSTNSDHRKVWEEQWGASVETAKGGGLREILAGIENGQIRALITLGEDPFEYLADGSALRETLQKLELFVVLDQFHGEGANHAHYLLPSASPFERDGHVVSAEGFVQSLKPAMALWGESFPDGEIILKIARHMGSPLPYEDLSSVTQEIFRIFPDLSPSTRNGKHFQGGTGEIILAVNRPQPPHKAHRESVQARVDEWRTKALPPSGKSTPISDASETPALESTIAADAEGRFIFQLSKSLNHSGKSTTFDANLMQIEGTGILRVPRQWARKRKIKKGDTVLVRSSHAEVALPVEPVSGLSDREIHFPLHFADSRIMAIFGKDALWHNRSGVPLGQSVSVTLENVIV
jgi:predicted molibdopterin-dependent oxidoreductase YjgC